MSWILLASCSALLSAAAAIIQKKVLFRLTALEFSFLVSVFVLLATSFVPFSADVLAIPESQVLIIFGKSVLGGIAFLLVMLSLQHNQISSALPLLGLTPAVTALMAMATIGEALQGWEWAGILLMIAGTYTLEKKPNQRLFEPFKTAFFSRDHYYIFGALGLFAVSSVVDKALVSSYRVDPLVVLFYQHITYVLVFSSALWIQKSSMHGILQRGKQQFPLIFAVALLTVGYRLTQLEATKIAPVALVLAIKRTSILYASFFGGRIFFDDRLRWKLVGGLLIVISGFIILRNVG
jgi:drug/metabolite transporter (DMT)-like permease